MVDQPEEELQRLLAHLQAEEFIYEQPAFPEPKYIFKHALTQEVAYNAVLLERRRVVHERAAQAIEGLFPDRLAEHYSALAHHYSRSGNTAKAVDYLQRAGQQAVQRSAYAEAISHADHRLGAAHDPAGQPRAQPAGVGRADDPGHGVDGHQGLCGPRGGTGLYPGPGAVPAGGETPQLFRVLWGLRRFIDMRARLSDGAGVGGSSS